MGGVIQPGREPDWRKPGDENPDNEVAACCERCGGDCAPECGRHPAGCVHGGEGYWASVEGCDRKHEPDEVDIKVGGTD